MFIRTSCSAKFFIKFGNFVGNLNKSITTSSNSNLKMRQFLNQRYSFNSNHKTSCNSRENLSFSHHSAFPLCFLFPCYFFKINSYKHYAYFY